MRAWSKQVKLYVNELKIRSKQVELYVNELRIKLDFDV